MSRLFFDGISEALFSEIPESTVIKSRVLLNIERFEIGQSYVTAKVKIDMATRLQSIYRSVGQE